MVVFKPQLSSSGQQAPATGAVTGGASQVLGQAMGQSNFTQGQINNQQSHSQPAYKDQLSMSGPASLQGSGFLPWQSISYSCSAKKEAWELRVLGPVWFDVSMLACWCSLIDVSDILVSILELLVDTAHYVGQDWMTRNEVSSSINVIPRQSTINYQL